MPINVKITKQFCQTADWLSKSAAKSYLLIQCDMWQ